MSSTDQTNSNSEVEKSDDGKKAPYPWIFYFAMGFMGASVAIMLSKFVC